MRAPFQFAAGLLTYGLVALFGQQYVITTLVGGSPPPTPANALNTPIYPTSIAIDAAGNVYFSSGNCVFRVGTDGILSRLAGTSRTGFSGDGGPATDAQLNNPQGLAVGKSSIVYIADLGNGRIRSVSPAGIITTVAGTGTVGYSGDGGAATGAQLFLTNPNDNYGYAWRTALAVDGTDSLYIADTFNNRVRKVSPGGIITTFAGNGAAGYAGDGGPATAAQLDRPMGVAVDGSGAVYITSAGPTRKVAPVGTITTFGKSTSPVNSPFAVDAEGSVYFGDGWRIQRILPNGSTATIAGGREGFAYDGERGSADPSGFAVDALANLYVADHGRGLIRMLQPSGAFSTLAGNGARAGDGGPAVSATLSFPQGLVLHGSESRYEWNHYHPRWRR